MFSGVIIFLSMSGFASNYLIQGFAFTIQLSIGFELIIYSNIYGFYNIYCIIGLFIIDYIALGSMGIPPIPDNPPPDAMLGSPAPIPPIPPRPPNPPNPIPPKPAIPAAPVPVVPYDQVVDVVALPVEAVVPDALFPFTKCTVTLSSILYSSKVFSSFKIFPIWIIIT